MALTNEQMKTMYLNMQRGRTFELEAERLASLQKVQGFIHLSVGQEAAAAGACMALRPDDIMTGTHRSHTACICKGANIGRMMAELFGKEVGFCKGKGGSIHIADFSVGILGANGIVGAGQTLGTGAALSAKVRGTDQVCLCCFGDGASNQGTFHEALNLAAIWNLPIIFFCENNGWQITTPFSYHTKIKNIADRAAAYGIAGAVVDGNDPIAVYEAVSEAVARARSGGGPTLIEAKTYRLKGHFCGDSCPYRDPAEYEAALAKDPMPRFRKYLLDNGICTEEEIVALEEQAKKDITDAVAFAESQPIAPVENTVRDVYSDHIEEGRNR